MKKTINIKTIKIQMNHKIVFYYCGRYVVLLLALAAPLAAGGLAHIKN